MKDSSSNKQNNSFRRGPLSHFMQKNYTRDSTKTPENKAKGIEEKETGGVIRMK